MCICNEVSNYSTPAGTVICFCCTKCYKILLTVPQVLSRVNVASAAAKCHLSPCAFHSDCGGGGGGSKAGGGGGGVVLVV